MKTYQTLVVALTAGTLTLISCSPIQQPYDLGGAAAGAALSNGTAGNRKISLDQQLPVGPLGQATRSIGSAKIKIMGPIPTEVTLLPPPQRLQLP